MCGGFSLGCNNNPCINPIILLLFYLRIEIEEKRACLKYRMYPEICGHIFKKSVPIPLRLWHDGTRGMYVYMI